MRRKNVCVIPARGGSKRIPHKNIINFFDKPMIAWTIEAALHSRVFDKVIVSTDDQMIADVSKKYGAEVPFLRFEKNDDHSTVSEATIACLKQAEELYGYQFENVVQLMANCPLRTAEDIKAAWNNFEKKNYHFQLSCFKYGWMNPWWAFKMVDGEPVSIFPEALKSRSQDLPELFCPTGAIWIAKVSELMKENTFYGKNYRLYPLEWISAVDIDDLSDLEMARAAFQLRKDF